MGRSFIEAAFESLEDRQFLSVSIPTRHAVPMHHPANISAASYHVAATPFKGVKPIVHPTKPPFTSTGGGGDSGGGGGVINHPGQGFHN